MDVGVCVGWGEEVYNWSALHRLNVSKMLQGECSAPKEDRHRVKSIHHPGTVRFIYFN